MSNTSPRAQSVREYKLVIVGGDAVGNTALIVQFTVSHFERDCERSIEGFYRKLCVIDEEVALLDLIDAGQEVEYRAMRERDIRTAEGFLLVYSITSRDSFEEVSKFHEEVLRVKDYSSFSAILVANKCDLEHERQVGMNEGRELAKRFGCRFIETSAKEGFNVTEAFSGLVREIRKDTKQQQTGRPGSGRVHPVVAGNDPHDDVTANCCSRCVIL